MGAWHLELVMARSLGRVVQRKGSGRNGKARAGYAIIFPKSFRPRYLYSARGSRFTSRESAEDCLDAIRKRVAQGVQPQRAISEFAPIDGANNGFAHWIAEYVAKQEKRLKAGDLRAYPKTPAALRQM
jgi:hypothetical protein